MLILDNEDCNFIFFYNWLSFVIMGFKNGFNFGFFLNEGIRLVMIMFFDLYLMCLGRFKIVK